ncbi:phosphotransferase family protein [Kitasatospora sp. MY 5-36]|uniref:phosphotransferase family protein n=1 Tax=Kitasatospora sp. MY 5-36 TaxID=1678027 RepID=UPI0006711ED6|nr:aminoglycoside phosphotransferase family protein [Kitasatospora sp. MY 5-36]
MRLPATGQLIDQDVTDGLAELAGSLGYTPPVVLSSGVEFLVYRASPLSGAAHEDVVLRVPRARTFHTANNVGVGADGLLEQELRITQWLAPDGFPVARALGIEYTRTGTPVLLSAFVDSDAQAPDWSEVGALFAALHAKPAPDLAPVVQYGRPVPDLLAQRLPDRFGRLLDLRPGLGELPERAAIAARLAETSAEPALLHLDLRRQNLLCGQGRVAALIDWSNVLIGDPAMELARMSEYALIPENGLDERAIRQGYEAAGGKSSVTPAADLLYRLDAAVMLALVFTSVAPDPRLGPAQTARVVELLRELADVW